MQLSPEELRRYRQHGYLILEQLFDAEEVDLLRKAFVRDIAIPGDHRIAEEDGTEVRAVYASHERQPEFGAFVRSPRVLEPVRQLMGTDSYIYQFKINSKAAFSGSGWSWHQDFPAWQLADNLPRPNLVNVALCLDDSTEFNGPVVFVPGSHRGAVAPRRRLADAASPQHVDPADIAVGRKEMVPLVDEHGMHSATGKAGTVVLFSPEVVHGSGTNMSPLDRRLLIVTFNDVANLPRTVGEPRPAYLVGRDTEPLHVVDEPLRAAALSGAR